MMTAVSYTHLDVYKRQSIDFTRPWSVEKAGEPFFDSITFNFVGVHGDTATRTYTKDDENRCV